MSFAIKEKNVEVLNVEFCIDSRHSLKSEII